jgi:hypothetical protein
VVIRRESFLGRSATGGHYVRKVCLKLLGTTALVFGAAQAASAQTAPVAAPAPAPQPTVIDGQNKSGIVVSGNSTLSGNTNVLSANTTIGNTSNQTVYTNFATIGGNGSGGGGGLGGVFFVDNGASLTLTNVSFANNTATGGQGGGVQVDSVSAKAFSLASSNVDASALSQIRPGLTAS